jgi:hypothetical protein
MIKTKEEIEGALTNLSRKIMGEMLKDDFEMSDINTWSYAISEIEKIEECKLKPYLIQWNLNVWAPIREFIESALEILGYEYVGNMDTDEYKFECEDDLREILFRYKGNNCDYTQTLKLEN